MPGFAIREDSTDSVGGGAHTCSMNVFDAEPYFGLLPRKVTRALAWGVLAFALLFPSTFQRWYIGQGQDYANHLAKQFLDVVVPKTVQPTSDRTTSAR
jgi:hypothetical protein